MSQQQWGHGFHVGKERVIRDILNGLFMKQRSEFQFPVPVHMKQIGGKYCSFKCPVCGSDSGLYKMSGCSGWCDTCESDFQNFDPVQKLTPDKGMLYPDAIGFLEVI